MILKRLFRKCALFLGTIFIGLITGFILLTLVTQTPFFRQWLRKTIIQQTQNRWGLSLSIKQIEGNLLTSVSFHSMELQNREGEKLSLDKLQIIFSPLELFRRKLTFPLLSLSGLKITIIKTEDRLVRILPFPPPSPKAASQKQKKANIPSVDFLLHHVHVQDGSIGFHDYSQKQLQKTQLHRIQADLSAAYFPRKETHTWQGHIQNFSFALTHPYELTVTNIQGNISRDLSSNINLSLLLSFEAEKQKCRCQVEGNLDLIDPTFPQYRVQTRLTQFPVAFWLPQKHKSGPPPSVDLQIRLEGKGIKPEEISLDFDVDSKPFILHEQNIDSVGISGQFKKNTLEINKLAIRSPMGLLSMEGQIDLTAPLPYQVTLSFEHLDAGKLSIQGIPSSQLSGKIRLRGMVGQNFPETFHSSGSVQLFPSLIGEKFLDHLLITGDYEAERLRLSQADIRLEGADLSMHGTISRRKMNVYWDLEKLDLAQIGIQHKSAPLEGIVAGEGKITGSLENPQFEAKIMATDILYKDYLLKQVTLEGKGEGLSFQTLNFSLGMQSSSFSSNQQNFMDSFTLEADKKGPEINWALQGSSGANQIVHAQGELKIPRLWHISAHVNELAFPLNQTIWQNQKPIHVEFDPSIGLTVHSLVFGAERQGTLSLEGEIKWAGSQRMELLFSGLPLQITKKWTGKVTPLSGTLDGKVLLTGTRASPEIEGALKFEKGKWGEFSFDQFIHSFQYQEKNLTTTLSLIQDEKKLLHITGQLPMDLSFAPVKNRWSAPGLAIHIKIEELGLGFLPPIAPFIAQISGSVSSTGRISGSLSEPKFEGNMEFLNTSFQIKPFLQIFTVKNAHITGDNQGITIDEIALQGESGVGKFSGRLALSEFPRSPIKANLKMDKWKILYSDGTYFLLSGELAAQGIPPQISVSGEVLVPEGKIRLSDFMLGQKKYPEVQIVKQKGDEEKIIAKKPSFFSRNISLDVKLKIPKNLWVSSDQASLELKGDLALKKTSLKPQIITGNIQSIRGIYVFYGKEFAIQKALIQFQGLPQMNPILDMKTVYKVGDINIFILITGTKNAPLVSLQSEPPLSQDDIVSYLVFGRATEDLNQRESAGLQGEAFALLGRVVATQVMGVFGEKLPVDTIQIRASEQGTSSLEFGKYVTRDVFVSFGKEFGLEGSEQLRVEYYLYSNLTLETEIRSDERSGVDLIWKKDF